MINFDDNKPRDNFARLNIFLRDVPFLRGKWVFFTYTFSAAVTNLKIPHNLGFMPQDVIQTSLVGAGALTWNYALFDKTNVNMTTTGACTVRAFVGTYKGDSNA